MELVVFGFGIVNWLLKKNKIVEDAFYEISLGNLIYLCNVTAYEVSEKDTIFAGISEGKP